MYAHLIRRGVVTVGLLIGGLAVIAALALAGLRAAGSQPEVVYSGSMEPHYGIGSLVFARTIPSSEVALGDVISFHDPQQPTRVITHRVVEILDRPEGLAYRTKGDANVGRDPWTIELPEQVGRVSFGVPEVGYMLWYARTREVRTGLIAAFAAATLAFLLRAIWRPRPQLSQAA
jgi:signal peptidase